VENKGNEMQNSFLDELKTIKSKLSTTEKEAKKVEDKKAREERLRNEFAEYMRNTGVKKKS
jgi:hypothetical protein